MTPSFGICHRVIKDRSGDSRLLLLLLVKLWDSMVQDPALRVRQPCFSHLG